MADPLIAPERLSELIGLIYDCAIDPARWPVAMEAIRLELSCHNATLDLIDLPSGTVLTSATTNIPPAYLPLLAHAGSDVVEQWGGEQALRALPLERPAVMSRANPAFESGMENNHYYQAFARPQGLVDVIAIGLARDARAIGAVAFGRHRSAGPIGEREITVAQLLLPHLQRAATINRFIEREANALATLVTTLDALAIPIALIDGQRRLVHANPTARAILAEGKSIRLKGEQLETALPTATHSLIDVVAAIAQHRSDITSRGVSLPIDLPDGGISVLHITPLVDGSTRGDASSEPTEPSRPVAAVFVSAGLTPSAAAVQMAISLFDLTKREGAVFEQLAKGHSQSRTASALQIAPNTVKTHLKRLYEKIGVNSHPELIAMATLLSIPVAA